MQKYMGTTVSSRMQGREENSENGLQSLVAYYQSMFDIEENIVSIQHLNEHPRQP